MENMLKIAWSFFFFAWSVISSIDENQSTDCCTVGTVVQTKFQNGFSVSVMHGRNPYRSVSPGFNIFLYLLLDSTPVVSSRLP